MIRNILAVVVGYALWSALWLFGNQLFFADAAEVTAGGDPYTETTGLMAILCFSFVCSLVAGMVGAAIARDSASRAVTIMALLLFITGVAVQSSYWALMPIWYHLIFLALIVPMCQIGGKIGARPPRTQDIPGV